jgi:hypothetical protein
MRAVKSADRFSELTPPSTPFSSSTSETTSKDKRISHSLPGSPVLRSTPNLQPSPALSATSDILRSEINPFLLPPLAHYSTTKSTAVKVSTLDVAAANIHLPPKSTIHHQQSKDQAVPALTECETQRTLTGVETKDFDLVELANHDPKERAILGATASKVDQHKSIRSTEESLSSKNSLESTGDLPAKDELAVEAASSQQNRRPTEVQHPPNHPDNHLPLDRPGIQPRPQRSGYYPPPGYPYHRYYNPMSYSSGYPPSYLYGVPPLRTASPYQTPYGNFPDQHPAPAQQHSSIGSRDSHQGDEGPGPPPGETLSAIEDDPGDLVERISSVIPDIHMLLSRSKVTHGELGFREQLLKKAEAETKETVKQKEDHISQLQRQLDDSEKRHAKDVNKYRFHLSDLDDKVRDLSEKLSVARLSEKAHNEKVRELDEQNLALLRELMALKRTVAEEKDRTAKAMEEWKEKTNELLEAEQHKATEEQVRLLDTFRTGKPLRRKLWRQRSECQPNSTNRGGRAG